MKRRPITAGIAIAGLLFAGLLPAVSAMAGESPGASSSPSAPRRVAADDRAAAPRDEARNQDAATDSHRRKADDWNYWTAERANDAS